MIRILEIIYTRLTTDTNHPGYSTGDAIDSTLRNILFKLKNSSHHICVVSIDSLKYREKLVLPFLLRPPEI